MIQGQSHTISDEVLEQYLSRYALDSEDLEDFPKLGFLLRDKRNSDVYIVQLRTEIQRQRQIISNLQTALLSANSNQRTTR